MFKSQESSVKDTDFQHVPGIPENCGKIPNNLRKIVDFHCESSPTFCKMIAHIRINTDTLQNNAYWFLFLQMSKSSVR